MPHHHYSCMPTFNTRIFHVNVGKYMSLYQTLLFSLYFFSQQYAVADGCMQHILEQEARWSILLLYNIIFKMKITAPEPIKNLCYSYSIPNSKKWQHFLFLKKIKDFMAAIKFRALA